MRTKTLLLACAALAVSLANSQAQVYSQNVVGYANLSLTTNTPFTGVAAYNLIANQLDADGTGTNNTVWSVFGTNLPVNTSIYAWIPNTKGFGQAVFTHTLSGFHWTGDTNDVNVALNPGGSVFVAPTQPTTVTEIGTVLQGASQPGTNITLTPGLEVAIAFPVPLSGVIDTNLNYLPNTNAVSNIDTVYTWDPVAQGFAQYTFSHSLSKGWHWSPSDPVLSVGQGVFLTPAQTTNWNVSFTVQ